MNPPVKKNESYPAEILSVTGEGFGVCKVNNFVLFVPETAPGDVCTVKVVKLLKHYGFGIATEFSQLSSERAEPDCPVYRQCGGCCFRHITYEAELAIKEGVVRDAFERIGGIALPPEPILRSLRTEHYRNKAQYPVGSGKNGMIFGFYANRSHRIIPSPVCALQPPLFTEIAAYVASEMEHCGVTPYEEETGKGELRHIYLRQGEASSKIMLCLVTAKNIDSKIKPFLPKLTQHFPSIQSVVLNINPRFGNVILGEKSLTLWGKNTIRDKLCGLEFDLSPRSFYQVNSQQTERLYQLVQEYAALKDNDVLIDFYCGVGTIGLSMASRCKKVIGVEVVREAVENAKSNASLNNIRNAGFILADAKSAVKKLEAQNLQPDVVVLDPPRKGCDPSVIESVGAMNPERVVMVSCNPSTAARDCKLFEEKGYAVVRYQPVDMFPRTKHVECVALITRNYK